MQSIPDGYVKCDWSKSNKVCIADGSLLHYSCVGEAKAEILLDPDTGLNLLLPTKWFDRLGCIPVAEKAAKAPERWLVLQNWLDLHKGDTVRTFSNGDEFGMVRESTQRFNSECISVTTNGATFTVIPLYLLQKLDEAPAPSVERDVTYTLVRDFEGLPQGTVVLLKEKADGTQLTLVEHDKVLYKIPMVLLRLNPELPSNAPEFDTGEKIPRKKNFTSNASAYACLLPKIREVAKDCGYAIAVHGSMDRDFDLVAVPWTLQHNDPKILIAILMQTLNVYLYTTHSTQPELKPGGRLAWSLYFNAEKAVGPYIDISVTPWVGTPMT